MFKIGSVAVGTFTLVLAALAACSSSDDPPTTSAGDSGSKCGLFGESCTSVGDGGAREGSVQTGDGGSSPSADSSTDVDPCQDCMKKSCSDEAKACTADCASLLDCVIACPDDDEACTKQCGTTYPNGVEPLNKVFACITERCEQDCS